MTKLFIILFVSIFSCANSQSDCFKNCRQRSIEDWEKLQSRGITSTDSALSCDSKIIANLKGCSFPAVELNNYDGGKFKISDLKGSVVFVHFWFVNCATCIAEMPSITKLGQDYKNSSVKLLAVSFNDKKTLQHFFSKKGTFGSIQTYIDQKTLESEFCILCGYPMNFVLDKNGKVIDAWTEENPVSTQQENFYQKVKALIAANL